MNCDLPVQRVDVTNSMNVLRGVVFGLFEGVARYVQGIGVGRRSISCTVG